MTQEEVTDAIEAWRNSNTLLSLHEYLDWSWEEYADWAETNQIPERLKSK